ncbi:MAG: hypothetical protein ABSA18_17185, partial [Dehalococcoidia bacterium]
SSVRVTVNTSDSPQPSLYGKIFIISKACTLKGNPTQVPWTVFVFLGTLAVGAIWYLSRKAYLKSKGIDLDGNLKKVGDATLAEAEEKLTV